MKKKIRHLRGVCLLLFCLIGGWTNAQNAIATQPAQNNVYYIQFMFDLQSQQEMDDLAFVLNSEPQLNIVRLDELTSRSWITTTERTQLDEATIRAWLGNYSEAVRCIDFGRLGIDTPEQYPFTNCNN